MTVKSISLNHNKGEWSELYVFLKILNEGVLYAASENNKLDKTHYLPIVELIRNDEGNILKYIPGENINIMQGESVVKICDKVKLNEAIMHIYKAIIASHGKSKSAFEIPIAQEMMNDFMITRVSSPGTAKQDVKIKIHDSNTGYEQEVGFSIKSYVGSNPTLLNPGKNTRIKFEVRNITDASKKMINSITKEQCKHYMQKRFEKIFEEGNLELIWKRKIEFINTIIETKKINFMDKKNIQLINILFGEDNLELSGINSPQFRKNLIMVDSFMPRIYEEMILAYYKGMNNKKTLNMCKDIVEIVSESDPCGYKNKNAYVRKFKQLLVDSALGMTPAAEWNGIEAANGGYIVVTKNGEVICHHLHDRNSFEEYLYNNAYFDRPGSGRYSYGTIYYPHELEPPEEDDGKMYIDVNVQIRFK